MPAAVAIPAIAAVVGGAIAAKGSKDAAKTAAAANQAQIDANQVDPRITNMLFGDGARKLKAGVSPTFTTASGPYGSQWQQASNPDSDYEKNDGVLGQFRDLWDTPQSAGMDAFGRQNDAYVGYQGGQDFNTLRQSALGMMQNQAAPQIGMSQVQRMQPSLLGQMPTMGSAQINAPSQNGTNLNPAFNNMIYGDASNNPHLTGAIQSGIDQSMDAFKKMQADATQNLTEKVLPSIRSNSIMSGGFGGSRQSLAEGGAIGDFSKQMSGALENFGRANTGAAVSAQAGAFNMGQDRALSAMSGLNSNQYNTAGQNAAFQQQAGSTNFGGLLSGMFANQGAQNNASQFNASSGNSFLGQNLDASLQTMGMNNQRMMGGQGLLNGLLSSAYQYAGNQDQYGMNRASQVGSLLQPYLSRTPVPTQLQPVYNNSASSALGGAMAGLTLASRFGGNSGWNSDNGQN